MHATPLLVFPFLVHKMQVKRTFAAPAPKRPAQTQMTQQPYKKPRVTIASQIGAVATAMVPEKKNLDVFSSATSAAATTWSLPVLIDGIPQGASAVTRIGRRVVLQSIFVRWNIQLGAAAQTARWVMIYDHAPNGVLPAVLDIFASNTQQGMMNLNNNDRFMVLHDEVLNGFVAAGTIAGKFYYKKQPLQQQYLDTATGTIADITTGAVYLMVCGLTTTTLNFTSRVRYTDL